MRHVKALVGLAMFTGALMASGAAIATPVFTVTPDAITGITNLNPVQASDINVASDSTIRQTGAATQVENGIAWTTGLTNNGSPVGGSGLGLVSSGGANTYGLYFTYTATVQGISGFNPGQTGTIGSGNGVGSGFGLTLYADIGNNNTYSPGTFTGLGATNPSIANNGNDIVLAVLTSISGSAGFQQTTGGPTINALENFVICDGTLNEGHLGGQTISGGIATGCGTFDALNYFTDPNPFYNVSLISATAGSANDITVDPFGNPDVLLNGVVADVNFVPEPLTISLFGAGLIGVGALRRRKAKKA